MAHAVLIIEDEAVLAKNMKTYLERQDFEAAVAASGEEGLAKLDAFTPPLIGYKKMANFRVWSMPAAGSYLLGIAWLLGPVVALLDLAARRKKA